MNNYFNSLFEVLIFFFLVHRGYLNKLSRHLNISNALKSVLSIRFQWNITFQQIISNNQPSFVLAMNKKMFTSSILTA